MTDLSAIAPADDFQAAPRATGPHHENPLEIFHRIHRLLRGRYLYAVTLSLLAAAAGAIGGYTSSVPKFQSVGMIRIQSPPVKVYDLRENRGDVSGKDVSSVAQFLKEPSVISFAMSRDEWRATGRGRDPEAEFRFREALRVETTWDAPEWIYVKFVDTDPKVAKTAVEQVIRAFLEKHGKTSGFITTDLIEELKVKVTTYQGDITQLKNEVRAKANALGTSDVDPLYRAALEQLQGLDALVQQTEFQIRQAEQTPGTAPAPDPGAAQPSPAPHAPAEADLDAAARELARDDAQIRGMLDQLDSFESRLGMLRARGLTELHRSVIEAQSAVSGQRTLIHEATRRWLATHNGILPGVGDVGLPRLTAEQLAARRAALKTFEEQRTAARSKLDELDTARSVFADLNAQIKKKEAAKAVIEQRLTEISIESPPSAEAAVAARINVISYGEIPFKPSSDNRLKFALIGLIFGGGIPFGLFLLWGLFDRRYRYSDEASGGRIHPTLLGILPYLPESVADPEQAAIAAHSVHQIRTLLQISGAHRGGEGGQVFAVTSPTSGDGKTSLTLSLALSFASSGANTCVIDFDLIGAGLTAAMNAKTTAGLLDAIDRGELNGHIKATGFKRLSIIPAGMKDSAEVSRLSPGNVSRVLRQAREQFDVVLVDTGPILGSIEAALVASAADGVILALGRGQARPIADRAMDFLASVGATLLGVVFNRAEPGDFRRAFSSASVRSVPNQGSGAMPALPALGAMARNVATHLHPSDSDAR